jgi:uncharacterized protein with PIN domain
MNRYYICPTCRTRMVRTGNKERIDVGISTVRLYKREYQCPRCGQFWIRDENRNWMQPGCL